MPKFLYEVTTDKSFDEAVSALEEQSAANAFRVLHIHDVKATLAEKGFHREPLKIVEVCNANYADMALKIEVTVSLLIPCRINVYSQNGQTFISTARPTALVEMFEKPELGDFAKEVEETITRIIEASK